MDYWPAMADSMADAFLGNAPWLLNSGFHPKTVIVRFAAT
jgi:hypothetical protein